MTYPWQWWMHELTFSSLWLLLTLNMSQVYQLQPFMAYTHQVGHSVGLLWLHPPLGEICVPHLINDSDSRLPLVVKGKPSVEEHPLAFFDSLAFVMCLPVLGDCRLGCPVEGTTLGTFAKRVGTTSFLTDQDWHCPPNTSKMTCLWPVVLCLLSITTYWYSLAVKLL